MEPLKKKKKADEKNIANKIYACKKQFQLLKTAVANLKKCDKNEKHYSRKVKKEKEIREKTAKMFQDYEKIFEDTRMNRHKHFANIEPRIEELWNIETKRVDMTKIYVTQFFDLFMKMISTFQMGLVNSQLKSQLDGIGENSLDNCANEWGKKTRGTTTIFSS